MLFHFFNRQFKSNFKQCPATVLVTWKIFYQLGCIWYLQNAQTNKKKENILDQHVKTLKIITKSLPISESGCIWLHTPARLSSLQTVTIFVLVKSVSDNFNDFHSFSG